MFFELHTGLPREGPGDDASTERALRLLPHLPARPEILDVGCGPGAQTLVLARATGGKVTAVDVHQPFLDELMQRARAAGLADNIRPLRASMDALPFEPESFDLIWSEGAIYIIGFEHGLRAWQPLVRHGGYVIVSELSWLVDDPSPRAREFWNEAYPAMQSVAENRAAVERCGYEHVADFVLPNSAWLDGYYTPLTRRIDALERDHANDPAILKFLAGERREIDLFHAHGDTYGYVFYLMRGHGPCRFRNRSDINDTKPQWKNVRVRLPAFLHDLIGSMALDAYQAAKGEFRADLAGGPETLRHVAESIAGCFLDAARQDLRRDFERVTLFGILFRSHADQSRRTDSVDATLGVVLTALLVLGPIAFDKGPTQVDKWIALVGFGLLVGIVARGLFFVGAPEPNAPALGAKLLGDLNDPVTGTLDEVRISIRTAADPRYVATKNETLRRGAAGDLVQLIAEDRERLWVKRFHLRLALAMFVALTGVIGWRDVI